MNRKVKTLICSLVVMLGFLILSTPVMADDTIITASVGKLLSCGGADSVINLGTVTPGNSVTRDFDFVVTTNSPSGFTVVANELNELLAATGDSSFIYNPSTMATTQSYKVSPNTHSSEWSGKSSGALTEGSIWSHNSGGTTTESLTIMVGTSDSTPAGTYTGTIQWTCSAS